MNTSNEFRSMVTILSIVYKEPEWAVTRECILRTGLPVVWSERYGVGSLALAINEGIKKVTTDLVWVVTNITFPQAAAANLADALENFNYGGLTPAFNSDHVHTRLIPGAGIIEAPFIEFTAPMLYTELLRRFPLDEDMPYWGHDLEFGHQVRADGGKLGVCHDVVIGHTYIRHKKDQENVYTMNRSMLRKMTNESTRAKLEKKYGINWKHFLKYY